MQTSLNAIAGLIGNTPLFKLNLPYHLYAKLEFQNFFGSIKDRPALFIIKRALEKGLINKETIVIESTSGNFGIALANICNSIGVRFIAVIDPNISPQKERLLRNIAYKVIKVTEKDDTGGYLLNRINTVKEFLRATPGAYNPNQYENPDNYLAYYHTLGKEICASLSRIDHVFISVSSCGTLIGLSRKLKEHYPSVKITAVDIQGSMIFSDIKMPRLLSGIGASMRSPLLDKAFVDDVVILSQQEIIDGCYDLLNRQQLFAGPSSGAAYMAARKILDENTDPDAVAVFISPDHGSSYLDNIYSKEWLSKHLFQKVVEDEIFE